MWPALASIVAAIIAIVIPLTILIIVVTHWQQINDAIQQVLHYPGVAIGSALQPLVTGALVFFGGMVVVGVGGYVLEKHFAGERAVPPTIGPITAPGYPAREAVTAAAYAPYPYAGYQGAGITGGFGQRSSRPSGRSGSSGGFSGGAASRSSRPRSSSGGVTRPSRAGQNRATAIQRRDGARAA